MQRVSKEYKASMKELLRERSYMMISFGLVNQEAMAKATIGNGEFAYFSKEDNLFGRKNDGVTYATLENDFSKVDGSMFFLPRTSSSNFYDTGLTGELPIDGVNYVYEMVINLNVVATDIKGLTIDFGEIPPVDFDISTSNGDVVEIRNNTMGKFVTEEVFENTTYIGFKFYSMQVPNTRLRIYSIQLGFGLTYYNDSIIDSSLSSYVSPISSAVPQIDFYVTLQNYDQYFNIDNPNSAINFLETGQAMQIWYGYMLPKTGTIEWFQSAELLCSEWEHDDYSATIKCQDIYRSMNDEYYKGEYQPDGITLFDLAVLVFEDAAIDEYYIDPYLKRITTKNPMPRVRHKEALQIIANAGRCILTQSATGVPQIKSSFVPEYYFSSNGETSYSNLDNIKNESTKYEFASFAENYSKVDAEMLFLPEDESTSTLNTGYISLFQSNEFGYFETNPIITVTQEIARKYYGFNIIFGSSLPDEFKIVTYSNGECVEELTYNSDTISRYMVMNYEFKEFDVMEIEFTKTQHPHNRITINHFGFGDITDFTMEQRDMMTSPKNIKEELVKRVDVGCFLYSKGQVEQEVIISEETEASEGEVTTYYLENASYGYSATFGNSADNVTIMESGAYYITVKFNTSGKYMFEVYAYRYKVVQRRASKELNNRGKVVEWKNPLIGDIETAQNVADWVGNHYDAGIEYEYDTRGNPELEANDVIYQQNAYVKDMRVRVYKHTVNFNGALSGKVSARRITSDSA